MQVEALVAIAAAAAVDDDDAAAAAAGIAAETYVGKVERPCGISDGHG